MIKNIYVDMLASKIVLKEINPITGLEFNINDVKKEEYKEHILIKIEELEKLKEENEKLKAEVIEDETN